MKLQFQTPVTTLEGQNTDLSAYEGKVLLIVNTASQCGFTPQYEGLEALHNALSDRGLAVLGFPCNQFGGQEPGSATDIQQFCQLRYGVSFPLFEKVDVNGEHTHPLFQQLKEGAPGLLGSQSIKWNFTKFLVDRSGTILRRYASTTKPAAIRRDIEDLL
jgi:glutathione peroxidase